VKAQPPGREAAGRLLASRRQGAGADRRSRADVLGIPESGRLTNLAGPNWTPVVTRHIPDGHVRTCPSQLT